MRANFRILPFDFSKDWSADIEAAINNSDVIIASECENSHFLGCLNHIFKVIHNNYSDERTLILVIYDGNISASLVKVLIKILRERPLISVYLSVEKR